MSLFEYPTTEPIGLSKHGVRCFYVFATLYVIFVTLLNIISVGYDSNLFYSSTGPTSGGLLWYEKLPDVASVLGFPAGTSCSSVQLSVNERKTLATAPADSRSG